MPRPRKDRLDALERRLTGPKTIALFGHRAVGKTTLLAMFYREAAAGRVAGVRLSAVDARTAEYLAEKVGQIESGEPPAGTLAETELRLRLYHGPGKLDLVVRDYQGEHVGLGSEAPIREFFAGCDAVFLCLDPDPAAGPAERTRRQQEVEQLLERYLEASDDLTAGRPVALLITKYDRVIEAGGPGPEGVGALVADRHGMTLHALRQHAPGAAIFAVSAFGQGARGVERPPATLDPTGLEGPLLWLADRLEAADRADLDWLRDLAPDDLPRLSRCVRAFERRYPKAPDLIDIRRHLDALRGRRLRRVAARGLVAAGALAAGAFGYDAIGYREALAFEAGGRPAPAIERHWSEFRRWHPSQPWTFPREADRAAHKLAEWRVKAAGVRVAVGTDPGGSLDAIKEQAPDLAPAIREVEGARRRALHDRRWVEVRAAEGAAPDRPEAALAALRGFLGEFPETPHRAEAERRLAGLSAAVADRREAGDRRILASIRQAGGLPDADLADLIQRARAFVDDRPDSRAIPEARALLDDYARRLDDAQFDRARAASKQHPANFALRLRKYQEYLDAHRGGGRHVSEAMGAIDRVERDRDTYMYRLAYDQFAAHPSELDPVVRLLRSYLDANSQGRHAAAARGFLAWHDRASKAGDYRVTLRRGEVEPGVGKYLAGGGPDLGVEVVVGGVTYGPSPVARNTHRPIWDYTFARPVRWKIGDPVTIKIVDHDWSASPVYTFQSAKGDPLSMSMLSGTVRSSRGGVTHLVFSSDFPAPALPKPE